MKVPNIMPMTMSAAVSLSRLQNEGSQPVDGTHEHDDKSIKATE